MPVLEYLRLLRNLDFLDPGQDSSRVWIGIRPSNRCASHREPIFIPREHRSHRAVSMAALLVCPDCEGAPSNPHAVPSSRMGHRASVDGGVPQLFRPAGCEILPRPVRGGLPAPLRGHHEPVV